MKIYFDTEFTGLQMNTSLISIGLIDEFNRTFYAEFTDYNKSQITPWISENVIKNLLLNNQEPLPYHYTDGYVNTIIKGDSKYIRAQLLDWLNAYVAVEWISDVYQYDMVLLVDLLTNHGSVFDLPSYISSCCFELNQLIMGFCGIGPSEAFDKSREDLVNYMITKYNLTFNYLNDVNKNEKHNSLYDAKIIKAIYEGAYVINRDFY